MNDGNPQIEQGYTRIANELYDAILKTDFTLRELKILMTIIRKTYGFNKLADVISLSQIEQMTTIKKQNNHASVRSLIDRNIIISSGSHNKRTLGINKHYLDWEGSAVIKSITNSNQSDDCKSHSAVIKSITSSNQSDDSAVIKTITKQYSNRLPQKTKDNIKTLLKTKEIIKEKNKKQTVKKSRISVYPNWLNIKLWQQFKENRKKLRAPMTDRAEDLAIGKLEILISDGFVQDEIINQSIEYGWKGLFPVRENNHGKNTGAGFSGHEKGDKVGSDWIEQSERREKT